MFHLLMIVAAAVAVLPSAVEGQLANTTLMSLLPSAEVRGWNPSHPPANAGNAENAPDNVKPPSNLSSRGKPARARGASRAEWSPGT